jgi:EmrB/QacA subfamily drug resistance transporter
MNPRSVTLLVLCLAAFVINLDTTIVNVALPTLVRELHASTGQLQWVIDAYNLVFAALVLAAGSVADRLGRRRVLLAGLGVFAAGSLAGSLCGTADQLSAARAVMGLGAAMIFPTTLSILSNVFPARDEKAKAIGLWGAMAGLGVALGPMTGGWLLERFWWGSVFVALAPPALAVAALALRFVPESADPATPRLDLGGLALSTAAVATLIYSIIEAPGRGWSAPPTLAGLGAAAVLAGIFVAWESRRVAPMMDVGLFRNPRFSTASGSISLAFFSLAGFVFLITQYFQFLKGYSPLSTGVRLLPVAVSLAFGSIAGTKAAVRAGNKAVIAAGLVLLAAGYAWVSRVSLQSSYLEIALQMVVLGLGMGLSSAPATEAIMGAVPLEKAGVGSGVNDATRQFGGTLGVAVIGSVYASLYTHTLAQGTAGLPAPAVAAARSSVGAALQVAAGLNAHGLNVAGTAMASAASHGFLAGLAAGCLVAAGVVALGAVAVAVLLPARPVAQPDLAAEATAESGAPLGNDRPAPLDLPPTGLAPAGAS